MEQIHLVTDSAGDKKCKKNKREKTRLKQTEVSKYCKLLRDVAPLQLLPGVKFITL